MFPPGRRTAPLRPENPHAVGRKLHPAAYGLAALRVRDRAAKGVPLLGICLGMQLLFEKGYEYGEHEGLSLLKGQVIPMEGNISEELKKFARKMGRV